MTRKIQGGMPRNAYYLVMRRGLRPQDYELVKNLNYMIILRHKETKTIKILDRNLRRRSKNMDL